MFQQSAIRENGIHYASSSRIQRTPAAVSNDVAPVPTRKTGQKRGRTLRVLSHSQVKQEPLSPSPTSTQAPPTLLTVPSPRRVSSKSPRLSDDSSVVLSGNEAVRSPMSPSPNTLNVQLEQVKQGSRHIVTSSSNQHLRLPSPLTPSPNPVSPISPLSPLVDPNRTVLYSPSNHLRLQVPTPVIPATVVSCDKTEPKSGVPSSPVVEQTPIVFAPRQVGYSIQANHIQIVGDRGIIQQCGSPAPICSLKTMVKSLNSDQQPRKVKVKRTVHLPEKVADTHGKDDKTLPLDNKTSVVQHIIRYATANNTQDSDKPKTNEPISPSVSGRNEKGTLDRYQIDKHSMKSFFEEVVHLQNKKTQETGLVSQPTQGSAQLTHGSAQPTQGSAQPTHGSVQPTQGSAQLTQGSAQPTQGSAQPTQGSAQLTQGSVQPTQGSVQPTQGSVQPTQGSVQPTQGSVQPTQGSAQLTQGSAQLTQSSAQQTQGSAQLTQSSAQPTQGSAQPTQGSVQPTQGSAESMSAGPVPNTQKVVKDSTPCLENGTRCQTTLASPQSAHQETKDLEVNPQQTINPSISNDTIISKKEPCKRAQPTVSADTAQRISKEEENKINLDTPNSSVNQASSTPMKPSTQTKLNSECSTTSQPVVNDKAKTDRESVTLYLDSVQPKILPNVECRLPPEPESPDCFRPLVICENSEDEMTQSRKRKNSEGNCFSERNHQASSATVLTRESPNPFVIKPQDVEGCKSSETVKNNNSIPCDKRNSQAEQVLSKCDPKTMLTYNTHQDTIDNSKPTMAEPVIALQNGNIDDLDSKSKGKSQPINMSSEKKDSKLCER